MTRSMRMRDSLNQAFSPETLEIIDDSSKHAGHAGAQPGGETHYSIVIVSQSFDGMNRVQMQRAVMSALQAEFDSGLHALSIKARAS